ncbi:MAG TPA: aminomethyltransferase family protein, partial [Steroidobacteraceae bacterium]|nr:aminomethyltransferase family protein [Steroidobacteraceae bacterium]
MKLTPLYQKHLELGATMYTTGTQYQMPSCYTRPDEEARAVRERVGMIDLSLMGRLDVKGKDALPLVQRLIVNNAARLRDGQALYSTMCNEQGLIVDDVVVMRFDARHFRVITSSRFRRPTHDWILRHAADHEVYLTDVSSGMAMIGVQGPKSRAVLQASSDFDLATLGFFRFASGQLAGMPCLIVRLGFSGELGYECYFNTEDGMAAWDAIAAAGKPHGIAPYGMDALDLLRLEKGFVFFGYDASASNNPYECGLWPLIRYDCGEFIGRGALLQIKERGPARKLMGLEVGGEQPASADQPLLLGGRAVGTVVTGFRSPTLARNLAYAWLEAPHFEPGVAVTVEIAGR